MDQIKKVSFESWFKGLSCSVLRPRLSALVYICQSIQDQCLFVHILQLYQPIVDDDKEMCTLNLTLLKFAWLGVGADHS